MNNISKIFYINLSRRPDRNEHFIKAYKSVGIPDDLIERFEALDGKIYKPSQEESKMFSKCDYKYKFFYNNILCNQLGHYYLLKEIIKREYKYAIICQDDVYFRSDFVEQINNIMSNIPDNAEIINIGIHSYSVGNKFMAWNLNNTIDEDFKLIGEIKINSNICLLKKKINPCSLAYIVTLQGAKNLVEYFNSNGFLRATDWNYNTYCIKKNIYYCSIPVLCTGNPNLGSDIF